MDTQEFLQKYNLEKIDNTDFNLNMDLNNAHIYIIKNKINNKVYVGKANCFIGLNNSIWGTLGRWKSHLDDAFKKNKSHCTVLNNALIKYGKENFEVFTIYKGPISTIGEKEQYYITLLNSKLPNGYNLRDGGDNGKFNDLTIQKMVNAHTGVSHSEDRKIKIGKGQIGNRRTSKPRKYEEDNDLPKYITSDRINKILMGYKIYYYPIGIDTVEYLNPIKFSIAKYESKENALVAAKEKLKELDEKYKHIELEIASLKKNNEFETSKINKENRLKQKLPNNIYPIVEENKIRGYYVDGIIDNNNIPFPKKNFIDKTNKWNLDSAKKYIDILNYINNNNVDISIIDFNNIYLNSVDNCFYEKYYLPKYFNIYRVNGEIKGFCINGFPNEKYKDGKFKKAFNINNNITMDMAYQQGIEYLNNLNKNKIYTVV